MPSTLESGPLERAALAFDTWDHDKVLDVVEQIDRDPAGDVAALPLPERCLAAHGRLLRAQLSIRADQFDQGLKQLAEGRRMLEGLPVADELRDEEQALRDYALADLAVTAAYVTVNMEQGVDQDRALVAAWQALDRLPQGGLATRLRVRTAILEAVACARIDAPAASKWARQARDEACAPALLALALQASAIDASIQLATAQRLRDAQAPADELALQLAQSDLALRWLETRQHDMVPARRAGLGVMRTNWYLLSGRLDDAERESALALALCAEHPASVGADTLCDAVGMQAEVALAQGRLHLAESACAQALELAGTHKLHKRQASWAGVAANVARVAGQPTLEVAHLKLQRRLLQRMRVDDTQRHARQGAALLAAQRARREAAAERLRQAQLEHESQALQKQAELLAQAACKDALTGLDNRRGFDAWVQEAHARARRGGHALGLAVVDVDHFKRVNDTWGHAAGDALLRRLADLLAASVRPGDLAARLGGEEFAIVLSRVSWDHAVQACERLREAIQTHAWAELLPTQAVTVSVGVVDAARFEYVPDALAEADRLLYQAKREGRNRVCAALPAGDVR